MLTKFAASAIFILVLLGNSVFIGFAAIYTDQFVIHTDGGPEIAKELARKHGYRYLGQVFDGYYHFQHHHVSKRSTTPEKEHHQKLVEEPEVKWVSQQTLKKRTKRDLQHYKAKFHYALNDPQWSHMWYLNRGAELDMNVQCVWEEGITGKGIVVTILDDGLEKDHPDIAQNYDSGASYDVNNHDEDPEPRYDIMDSNRHGTRCAGEVAAIANNSICAVGVAYEASVGGVRMLDGDVTDAVEARSLSLNPNHIDIYSASWGPDDDGKTVDGPGELATRAFVEGVTKGRNGLGSIFVWASGNGGRERDNCNCDGYTNSIWTLSISSATENGLVPWYSEACSSTLATTYSSGSSGERQIVTTDLHHGCTSSHTGTSASAPLAAGICALALQVNKNLTWRDMQHIVLRAARPINLHAKDWKVNGVGRNVSHSFGYGLMDAHAMVDLAKKWKTVPLQKVCEVRAERIDKIIPPTSHVELSLGVQCQNVKFLEHVQAKISLTTVRRGDIHIYLTSPMGTRSTLLALRPSDTSRSGFQAWPFMTVHSWGENPNGEWRLEVHNEAKYYGRATLKEWSLILYGTLEDPDNPKESEKSPPVTFAAVANSQPVEMTTAKALFVTSLPPSSKAPYFEKNPTTFVSKTKGFHFENNALNSQEPADMPLPQFSPGLSPVVEQRPSDSGIGVQQSTVSASECILRRQNGLCLGCSPATSALFVHTCVSQCPKGFFRTTKIIEEIRQLQSKLEVAVCLPCHYTCKECIGPNDYQCSACPGDSNLEKGYCYGKLLLHKLEGAETRYRTLVIVIAVFASLIGGLLFYLVIACLIRRFSAHSQYCSVPHNEFHKKVQNANGSNSNLGQCVPYYESDDE